MLLAGLIIISSALTCTMFASKQAVLGFPCLIFWAILGGYCYQQSTATWDIYYLTFFGAMGMAIFCAFAAYGLRTKKEELAIGDEYIDEGKDDVKFIDEGGKPDSDTDDGEKPRRSSRNIRERAERRRAKWD